MFIWAIREVGTNLWFERFCFSEFRPVFSSRLFSFYTEDAAHISMHDILQVKPDIKVEIKKFQLIE